MPNRMSSRLLQAIIIMLCTLVTTSSIAQIPETKQLDSRQSAPKPAKVPNHSLLNINNITAQMPRDNSIYYIPPEDHAIYFPRGTGNVVYRDFIVWGGKAYCDMAKTKPAPAPLIRVGGGFYLSWNRAGRIIGFGATARPADPEAAESRIYRIRRDYFHMSPAALRQDAVETFAVKPNQVTVAMMQAIKDQYARDWVEWPVPFGAPFIDRNHNGIYDPPPPFAQNFTTDDLITGGYDEPGISDLTPDTPADQVIWTVHNDLHFTHLAFNLAPRLGLEIQETLWAYKSDGALGNTFFRRARFINKGGVEIDSAGTLGAFWIDSMYVALQSDLDIGYTYDDLAGCDTLMNMGFVYNGKTDDSAFAKFNLAPPAAGYVLLQGPHLPALGDSALFDFKRITNWKNLPMTSFAYFSNVYIPQIEQCGSLLLRSYNKLKGFDTRFCLLRRQFLFPPGFTPNLFPLSGDPVTRRGFIDGFGTTYSHFPNDREIVLSSGPFTLAPGDTQEVVYAFVAGLGGDRLSSITHLKFLAKQVRYAYPYLSHLVQGKGYEPPDPILPKDFKLSLNYPNPFNGLTRISYGIPQAAEVRLAIYDLLGREIVVLENNQQAAGFYNTSWDGRNREGRQQPSGVYIYRLQAGAVTLTRKLLLLH